MQLSATLARASAPHQRIPMAVALFYFMAGMAPISALALAIFGLWSLPVGTVLLVLPAVVGSVAVGLLYPAAGRLASQGFGLGLLAVTVYDGTRLPFILTGLWGDFIPKIGGWLLSQPEPNWLLGYLWRYLGNGGGMGMAFTVLYIGWLHRHQLGQASRFQRSVQVRRAQRGNPSVWPRLTPRFTMLAALGFGLTIWACLLLTLWLAPQGQTLLFPLTPLSFVLSLIGHVVYGAVLGGLIEHWQLAQGSGALGDSG
jgi:hypothetical protein